MEPKLQGVGTGQPPARRRRDRRVVLAEHDDPRGFAWATFQYGRYSVLVRLAMVDGYVEIVSYEVRGFEGGEEASVAPVTTSARQLPLAKMRRMAASHLVPGEPQGVWWGLVPPKPAGERRGRPREHDYAEVARIYGHAVAVGDHPVEAVARHLKLDRARAAKLVARVRRAGIISSTTKGKVSRVSQNVPVGQAREETRVGTIRPIQETKEEPK